MIAEVLDYTTSPAIPPEDAIGLHRLACWARACRVDGVVPEYSVSYGSTFLVVVTLVGVRDRNDLYATGTAEGATLDEAARLAIRDVELQLQRRANGEGP